MRHAALVVAATALALPLGLVASAGHEGGYLGPFDPSGVAGEIPEPMLAAYLDAAARWDLDWALLAAIGKIECNHGRLRAAGCWPPGTINHAGARGPMQFLGSTWRASSGRYELDVAGPPAREGRGYGTDGDGDGIADPWSTYDAVHAAARFLVDLGGREDPRRAAKGYNAGPANPNPTAGEAYATKVVELMARYHQLAGAGGPGSPKAAFVGDGFALPFDAAGLHAVTTHASPPRDPEWQLVKPHHSGRVASDVSLPVGTTLYALAGGAITWAGETGACGYSVAIRHTDQHALITYCHLSRIDVAAGDGVTAGQLIGRSGGATGAPGASNSTGPHLHLQIETPAGRRCPQALLLGLWRGWPVPTISALRTSGCTYTSNPPPPQRPVPIPPELRISAQQAACESGCAAPAAATTAATSAGRNTPSAVVKKQRLTAPDGSEDVHAARCAGVIRGSVYAVGMPYPLVLHQRASPQMASPSPWPRASCRTSQTGNDQWNSLCSSEGGRNGPFEGGWTNYCSNPRAECPGRGGVALFRYVPALGGEQSDHRALGPTV